MCRSRWWASATMVWFWMYTQDLIMLVLICTKMFDLLAGLLVEWDKYWVDCTVRRCVCGTVCDVMELCRGCMMMLVDESPSFHHVTSWITAPHFFFHRLQSCNHHHLESSSPSPPPFPATCLLPLQLFTFFLPFLFLKHNLICFYFSTVLYSL